MRRLHRYMAALIGTAAALGLGTGGARAAQDVFLQLTGAVQGAILGSAVQSGQSGRIEVQEIHDLLRKNPSTNTNVLEPFIFTKEIERSTVNLMRAFDTNETLTAVFRYYQTSQTGQLVNFFTVTLTDAVIVAIEPIMADNRDSALANLPQRERIRMNYARIRFDFPGDGNETYEVTSN